MIVFIVASAPTESNMLTAARGSGGEKDVSASTTYELQEYLIWGSVLGLAGPRVNILVDCDVTEVLFLLRSNALMK